MLYGVLESTGDIAVVPLFVCFACCLFVCVSLHVHVHACLICLLYLLNVHMGDNDCRRCSLLVCSHILTKFSDIAVSIFRLSDFLGCLPFV